jgi:putative endonuclease
MAQHLETGAGGEQLACRYLEGRGFRVLERNWRSGPNELDIICTDGKFLVVVEVKTRRSAHWGEPELAVNKAKRTGIMRATQNYLNRTGNELEVRYDIVSVTLGSGEPQIEHIPDAFYPTLK